MNDQYKKLEFMTVDDKNQILYLMDRFRQQRFTQAKYDLDNTDLLFAADEDSYLRYS